MSLPTIYHSSASSSSVDLGNGVILFFSYQTLIGFSVNGKRYVSENLWGPTTGKHLNAIDGGNKTDRLPRKQFEEAYVTLTTIASKV